MARIPYNPAPPPPSSFQPPARKPVTMGGVAATPGGGLFGGQQSSAQFNAQRARAKGDAAANRGAFQNDYGQSNEARGVQQQALGLSRDAALGKAPSRAELLGQKMIGDSLDVSLAGGASARGGPMAQAAATRAAAQGAAAFQQRGAADLSALRADEIARARGELMQGSSAMRGQDLGAVGMTAENERFQRGLNQQGELGFEGMANDVDYRQASLDMQGQMDDSANWRAERQNQEHRWEAQAGMNQRSRQSATDRALGVIGGAAKGVGGAIAGILSDPRTKTGVQDLSAPMGSHEPWMPAQDDVDAIRFGTDHADAGALDDRYAQQANPPAPWLEDEMQEPAAAPTGPKGVAGAPMGYAASRRGQAGSLFDAPMEADPAGGASEMAPGTSDWDKYGQGAATAGAPDWTRGGATARPRPSAALRGLAGGLQGFGGALSDPATKTMLLPMSGPASPSFAGGGGMLGGSPTGELQAHSDFATQFQRNAGSGPFTISDPRAKREAFQQGVLYGESTTAGKPDPLPDFMQVKPAGGDGGPKPLVREGPQTASRIDPRASQYETKLSDQDEQRFQAWKKRFAPNDSGADYDLRGAFKAGLKPGADGHWPDTFKKPNHETFSDESKYARGDDARKAGHWNGDNFSPADPRSAPPAEMLDAVGSGKTFRYKPGVGEDPNKQHFGTTTEDLKKTPMGASMVAPGAVGGFDAIDVKEAVGPTIAAMGNLNQRLRRLEGTPQPEHVSRRRPR